MFAAYDLTVRKEAGTPLMLVNSERGNPVEAAAINPPKPSRLWGCASISPPRTFRPEMSTLETQVRQLKASCISHGCMKWATRCDGLLRTHHRLMLLGVIPYRRVRGTYRPLQSYAKALKRTRSLLCGIDSFSPDNTADDSRREQLMVGKVVRLRGRGC